MRRSSEPEEQAQFSVAELLARYGEPTPTTGRRRRRAPDDTGTVADTAAQPTIEPSRTARTDSGDVSLPVADLPSHYGSSQDYSSPSYLNGRGNGQWTPAVGTPTVGTPPVGQPSPVVGRQPLAATVLSDDSTTVQFSRLKPAAPEPPPWPSRLPSGGEPPAGLGTATHAIPEQKVNGRLVTEHVGQARDVTEESHDEESHDEEPDDEEPDVPEYGSPVREWAVMVAQIGIGVVGGAALWLICEWLWQQLPVVALAVVLAVITGLVWVVRRVRRAEDLQTTVIAVLVGLFVTVSPAALLLVGGR
jgi:hypothetical protein